MAGAATSRAAKSIEEWAPPACSLSGAASRGRDFARFAELQAALRKSCTELLHFTRRDFPALAQLAPHNENRAILCQKLSELGPGGLSESVAKFAKSLEALLQRVADRERLRLVFIGRVGAGKSTLINMLLTSALPDFVPLLPTGPLGEANCTWKVTSCDGSAAAVLLDDRELRTWSPAAGDAVEMGKARIEIAKYLDTVLSREERGARPENHSEITVSLPLEMLNPFNCHYCLVDTPGYTEKEEYEAMVAKHLSDHSHIACMVCDLNEGKAIVQSTRNMMSKSDSITFWVLTKYDDLMAKCKGRQGPRQVADKAVQAFQHEVHGVDADARVFKHAARMLMPEEAELDSCKALRQHLPREEAANWLQDIRVHVKDCFLELQQRHHVLSSQSRHCIDAASAILDEYALLRAGSPGALAANECYVRELQNCAEEAANELEREFHREVEAVKSEQLDLLCQEAARALKTRGSWTFFSQQSYYEALSGALAPMVQRELQQRLDAAERRAHMSVWETAQRLLVEAGTGGEGEQVARRTHDISAQDGARLQARFPLESVMTRSAASFIVGGAVASEIGSSFLAVTLGLCLGAAPVAGLVGVAVISIAALGYTMSKAAEVSPCWTYASTEADVVAKIRQANRWGILAESLANRARAHLLSSVSQERCSLSVWLLHCGAPQYVLESLFPDLPLFEEIHRSIATTGADIREFANARDLSVCASRHLQQCRDSERMLAWGQIIETTSAYIGSNARTDSIAGEALASLLHLRCHALVMADMFGEARMSAEVFGHMFPELLLPVIYRTAAHVCFESLRGSLDGEAALAEVRGCLARLDSQRAEQPPPQELEIWFHAVVASWLKGAKESMKRLLEAVRFFVVDQMKDRPSREKIVTDYTNLLRARASTGPNHELRSDLMSYLSALRREQAQPETHVEGAQKAFDDVQDIHRRECAAYARAVASSVHLLLGALPPSHLRMDAVGRPLLEAVLAQVSLQLPVPPAMGPDVEAEIRSRLCPAGEGSAQSLCCEEWALALGEALQCSSPRSASPAAAPAP